MTRIVSRTLDLFELVCRSLALVRSALEVSLPRSKEGLKDHVGVFHAPDGQLENLCTLLIDRITLFTPPVTCLPRRNSAFSCNSDRAKKTFERKIDMKSGCSFSH